MAEDLGGYYRVASDKRDLNYAAYFSEGDAKVAGAEDYNSHNTRRLDVKGMAELLQRLDVVQRALQGDKVEV